MANEPKQTVAVDQKNTQVNPLTSQVEVKLPGAAPDANGREPFVDSRDRHVPVTPELTQAAVDRLHEIGGAVHFLQDKVDHGGSVTRQELDALKGRVDDVANALAGKQQ